MIDGFGEIILYFVCLHVTKNLVIAFFHDLSWDKKAADIGVRAIFGQGGL